MSLLPSAKEILGPVRLLTREDVRLDLKAWNDERLREALRRAGWKEGKRVAYLSAYDPDYGRTRSLLMQLRRIGVEPETFFCGRTIWGLFQALRRIRASYDVVIVGFRGQEIVPVTRLVLRKKGIMFDAFVSVADTLADRGYVREGSWAYRLLVRADRWLCSLADAVLVDTRAHAAFFRDVIGCDAMPVYAEADERFSPADAAREDRILWYGTCLPLHGLEKILRWAAVLQKESPVRFLLIGPLRAEHRRLMKQLNLTNVDLLSWVASDELPSLIRSSVLCLGGPFGDSAKARRVIAAKTYHMIACGASVLVSDTPANRELLEPAPPPSA